MRFLFIDDEPIRALPLVRLGHEVHIACGVAQVSFYLKLSGLRFDAVWLDHDMPGMDGHEVAAMFLTERSIPVIIHSSNTEGAMRIKQTLDEYETPNLINNIAAQQSATWALTGIRFIRQLQGAPS